MMPVGAGTGFCPAVAGAVANSSETTSAAHRRDMVEPLECRIQNAEFRMRNSEFGIRCRLLRGQSQIDRSRFVFAEGHRHRPASEPLERRVIALLARLEVI